ncbi:MAG: hypothetical protein ABI382_04470 [Nakamurella sp.]
MTAAQTDSATYARYRQVIVQSVTERLRQAEESGLRPEDLGDPEVLARRAGSVIPVLHPFDDIAGPFYDTAGVTGWLGMSRQAVHKAVRVGRMIACRTQEGHLVYPSWQFTDDARVVESLPQVLSALGDLGDGWRVSVWLRAPAPYLPSKTSAIDWLADGRDPQPVITAARDDASRWAA